MKLMKRITVLFLCFLMLSSGPINALATSVSGNDVVVENCSMYGESIDENACNCGENVPENIANHEDGCPRKQYIKSLFDGKDAEEIYAQWENYDATTQNDLLNMLQLWDGIKYEELKALVENNHGFEDFSAVTVDGVSVGIVVESGVFPEGTIVNIEKVEEDVSEINSAESVLTDYFSEYTVDTISYKVLDITFTNKNEEIQPDGTVFLTFDIPEDEVVSSANILTIFHISDSGETELMAIETLDNSDTVSVTVEATSFSHYVILQSATTYKPVLLRDKLSGNSRYSIVEFPVTLNDFDAQAYNDEYGNSGLWFTTGTAGKGMNLGALSATQGIVKETLSDSGYPVTTGEDRGSILFSTEAATGKTSHSNVNFEFIYDNESGYYTYNSGANHAQYNDSTNKVELYADTLAPFNYLYSVFDKVGNGIIYAQNSAGYSRRTQGTESNVAYHQINVMKPSTIADMFYVDNLTLKYHTTTKQFAYHYGSFYMRMKSNHSGQIQAKVTYNDGSTQSFSNELVANQWTDYIFGDFAEGKEITALNFYLPNAKKDDYVQYSAAGFLQTENGSEVNFAGFYPFNTTLTTSYSGSEKFDMNTWANLIQTGNNHKLYSSRVMYNTKSGEATLKDEYAYFTMAMEVDFYIPADGKVNDEDIIFNFNGDDDMWVFVDGKLALDIGGAHTDVAGRINFTDGSTYVANVRSLTDSHTKGNGPSTGNLSSDQYATGRYHKLKIFYMERAGTNSNCLIKFNLPVVPTGNVIVEKTVETENGKEIIDDLEFQFQIKVAGVNHAKKSYTLVTKGADGIITSQESKITDSEGKFTLEHNQSAYFADIDENMSVEVTEISPVSSEHAIYQSTKVNGSATLTASGVTSKNNTLLFSYVNNYAAFTDIVISKTLYEMPKTLIKTESQSFIFNIKGIDHNTQDIDITVAINISSEDFIEGVGVDSVIIKNVPIGKYKVTEHVDWSWRYTSFPDPAVIERTVDADPASNNNKFSFKNTRNEGKWLSGDSYCENWWGGNGGVIVRKDDVE